MKKLLLAAVLVVAASQAFAAQRHATSAQPVLPDGYHVASQYERIKAQCEMVADGSQEGGFAIGNSNFVAGYGIGHGIRNLVLHARSYDQCMTINGYAH